MQSAIFVATFAASVLFTGYSFILKRRACAHAFKTCLHMNGEQLATRGLLFDCDGVIVETEARNAICTQL